MWYFSYNKGECFLWMRNEIKKSTDEGRIWYKSFGAKWNGVMRWDRTVPSWNEKKIRRENMMYLSGGGGNNEFDDETLLDFTINLLFWPRCHKTELLFCWKQTLSMTPLAHQERKKIIHGFSLVYHKTNSVWLAWKASETRFAANNKCPRKRKKKRSKLIQLQRVALLLA